MSFPSIQKSILGRSSIRAQQDKKTPFSRSNLPEEKPLTNKDLLSRNTTQIDWSDQGGYAPPPKVDIEPPQKQRKHIAQGTEILRALSNLPKEKTSFVKKMISKIKHFLKNTQTSSNSKIQALRKQIYRIVQFLFSHFQKNKSEQQAEIKSEIKSILDKEKNLISPQLRYEEVIYEEMNGEESPFIMQDLPEKPKDKDLKDIPIDQLYNSSIDNPWEI